MGRDANRFHKPIIIILIIGIFFLFNSFSGSNIKMIEHSSLSTRVDKFEISSEEDITPAFYHQGDLLVGMSRLEFKAKGGGGTNTGDIYGITVTHTGTGLSNNIEAVLVYEDVDEDSVFEPSSDDVLLGEGSSWDGEEQSTITLNPTLSIEKNKKKNIFIAYNFSTSAVGTHGVCISKISDIDAQYNINDDMGFIPANTKKVPFNK